MKTYVLWGKKKDYTWQEDIITEQDSLKQIQKAKEWAITVDYTEFRIMEWKEGDYTNFTETLTI